MEGEEGEEEEGGGAALAPEQPSSFMFFADGLIGVVLIKDGSPLRSWCSPEHKLKPRCGVSSGVALRPGRAEAPATHARRRTKQHESRARRVKRRSAEGRWGGSGSRRWRGSGLRTGLRTGSGAASRMSRYAVDVMFGKRKRRNTVDIQK
jgi:hypothetical protein